MTPSMLKQPALLALVTAVLVTAGVLAAMLSAPPLYTSTAVLAIDQPGALAASDDAGVIEKLSRLRFTYAGLVGTDRVAAPVAERLGEPLADVRGRLTAQAELQDLLLRVTGSDDTAAGARRTASALAEVLIAQLAAEQQALGAPAPMRVSLTTVRPAVAVEQVAPSRTRALAVAVLLGVLSGATVGGGLLLRRRRAGDSDA